jgi:CDP-glycerol glycerophosphotransferase (TagB/SpsB family)
MKNNEILNTDFENLTISQILEKLDYLVDEIIYLRAVRESYKKRVKRYQQIIEALKSDNNDNEINLTNPII